MAAERETSPTPPSADLERYRPYLSVLAATQLGPQLRGRVDLSGVVQQTFLDAHQQAGQLRATEPGQVAAWLRQILAHNLADAARGVTAAKRDAGRERSLEDALSASSARLGDLLAADTSSPSLHARREERAVL